MRRKFWVTMVCEVTLDQELFDAVTPEWRAELYDLNTDEEVAEHLAFNLSQGRPLNTLDGWADKDNKLADVNDFHVDSVEEQEPEEEPKPRKAKKRWKRG